MVHADGSLKVKPSPAKPDQEVEVTYTGPGKLYWRQPGGRWNELPIDPMTKKGRFKVPRGARNIDISNRRDPPIDVLLPIEEEKP